MEIFLKVYVVFNSNTTCYLCNSICNNRMVRHRPDNMMHRREKSEKKVLKNKTIKKLNSY